MLSNSDVVVRMLIAAALGGLIGLERELRDQPAGLRTHILVGLGSCLFALVGAFGFEKVTGSERVMVQSDVTRVASQIVVGIGFLGGGTILRHGANIRGLTTAASLWVTAAVGLAVAMGFYAGALTAAVIGIFSLSALKPIEKWIVKGLKQEDEPPPSEIPPD